MTTPLSPGRQSLLWKLVCVILWASEELVTGLLIERYSALQVVWVRFAAQLVLMGLLWGRREPMQLVRTARPWLQISRAAMMVAMPVCWFLAMQRNMAPDTLMAVFWSSPILLLLCAHVLSGERAPATLWIAAAAACLGANLFFSHDRMPTPTTVALALGMTLSFVLFVVATRALRHERLRANLFYTAAGVVVLMLPLLPGRWVWPDAMGLAGMVSVGVLGFGALYALERMAAAAPVSLTAPATGLQLLPSIGAAWLAGQHAWSWSSTLGAVVVVAVAMALWWLDPAVRQRPGLAPAPGGAAD
jgi:drug/metabolite transporter (DMT)-like permease